MMIPPFLAPGDLFLVIAPAFSADENEVLRGIQILRKEGFRVEMGPHVFSKWGKFAGTDPERLADLQWALDHKEAKAIICTRGGYGLSRILDQLDLSSFQNHPKWVIGFSDITLLHIRLQESGYASLHGPMLVHFSRKEQEMACKKELEVIGKQSNSLSYPIVPANGGQKISTSGLVGGNLTMLSHHIGNYQPGFFNNTILFVEEIGEYYYRIDRMLEQLKRNGILEKLSGVVLGQFTVCEKDNFPLSIQEMVVEKTNNQIPVFYGLESGHGVPAFPLILGFDARIDQSDSGFILNQQLLPAISSIQES
jgi:muramoyltetrapeptide carboxypeptidase